MSDAGLILSVSGLRGIVGASLTAYVAQRYGAAVGWWLRESCGKAMPRVVVGHDSRPSGADLERAAQEGLGCASCCVTSLGIVSTPGVSVMVDHLRADGGLVITASHNPSQWNGIKVLDKHGMAPREKRSRQIASRFKSELPTAPPTPVCFDQDYTVARVHAERVVHEVAAGVIRGAGLRVVVDVNHGAGGAEAAALFGALQVTANVIGGEPTGEFAHTPEPTRENLTGLCAAMKGSDAHVGFALDPDADRLAIVDERGVYIGEEYTLALCAEHVLSKRNTGGQAASATPKVVVTNLSTSRMVDDVAARHGAVCERTPVGEANVAGRMRKVGAAIGGEGNGGVILPGVCYVRDSMAGMALVLEMLARSGKPLSWHVAQLPAYHIVKEKIDVSPERAARAIELLKEKFADERIDLQDGVRIDRASEKSWVHVRPSNTEPILRIIAEGPTEEVARRWVEACRRVVE